MSNDIVFKSNIFTYKARTSFWGKLFIDPMESVSTGLKEKITFWGTFWRGAFCFWQLASKANRQEHLNDKGMNYGFDFSTWLWHALRASSGIVTPSTDPPPLTV